MLKSAVAATAALLFLVLRCAGEPTALHAGSSARQAPEIFLTAGGLVEISPHASCPVQGNLEGVFAKAAMPAYLQCIVPMVDRWIDASYARMPHPGAYYFVPSRVSGVVRAGNNVCPYDDTNIFYCDLDKNIYLGAEMVWLQYSHYGDAAVPSILAHEVTHHFQVMRSIPFPTIQGDIIRHEDQADCGAGAFMAFARNQGWMSKDDILDIGASLWDSGEQEGPDRVHGTIAERLTSYDTGYLSRSPNPLSDCNRFIPEIPLIVS